MVNYYEQASRDYDFVPSIGSSIGIKRYPQESSGPGDLPTDWSTLDIEQCRIEEIFTNKITTHSGSNGATLRTRVGGDWRFTASLSFPANIFPEGLAEEFMEPLLGSMRSVAVRFNIGSPYFWAERGMAIRSLRVTKCLLGAVSHNLDSRGTEVAMMDIVGESNSLLWTYLDDKPMYPQIWLV